MVQINQNPLTTEALPRPTTMTQRKVVIATGFALFAMFFGAGNIIFPLYMGANAGQHILVNVLGFLIAGVGVPILGLLATSMFQGDYWAFFGRLGKIPAFLIITFLIISIGPLGAMPRAETLVFNTILPYLPSLLQSNTIFSLFFCALVFALAYKETKVVHILGFVLSPIKIVAFATLISIGIFGHEPMLMNTLTTAEALKNSLIQGYSTMDLLATFFFCAVAFKSIEQMKDQLEVANPNLTKMIIQASLLGATLIGTVYLGFMLVAYNYKVSLQGVPVQEMVVAIAPLVLGRLGGLFVCITVSFACLATALALTEVCSNYLYKIVFRTKMPKRVCLLMVTLITYLMSNLGFQGIMAYLVPILAVLYPALITLSIMNILYKWRGIQSVKFPVFLTAGIVLMLRFI